jgi:Family of unknown function (DUF6317)
MSGGFQVVMSDLQSAAGTFHAEARTFLGIVPADPAPPDGGSGSINSALAAVMGTISLLHLQIGGDIDSNGTKLQTAHDHYSQTEDSLVQLAQQIATPGSIH